MNKIVVKIVEKSSLNDEEQEWFKDYVKWIIVINDQPVGGYSTKEKAEKNLQKQLIDYQMYGLNNLL